jgi:hypothetical protein
MQDHPNSDLKRFFKKFVLLLVILVALDFIIGKTLKFLFFKEKLNSITYVMNTTTADFLVFGSSRASRHYVPAVFEKKFNTTFYNCGRDASKMIYNLAAMSAVLERYRPKQIVLELDPDEFGNSEENSLSMLLPYRDNTAVANFIKYNSRFERFKLLSQIYPYNSMIGDIIMGNLSSHKAGFGIDVEGYLKFDDIMDNQPVKPFKYEKLIQQRVDILDAFLNQLHRQGIKITVVISPIYFTFAPHNQVVAIMDSFCKKYSNVSFINYENDPRFFYNTLFHDDLHMNDTGAHKFSEDLADKLIKN